MKIINLKFENGTELSKWLDRSKKNDVCGIYVYLVRTKDCGEEMVSFFKANDVHFPAPFDLLKYRDRYGEHSYSEYPFIIWSGFFSRPIEIINRYSEQEARRLVLAQNKGKDGWVRYVPTKG